MHNNDMFFALLYYIHSSELSAEIFSIVSVDFAHRTSFDNGKNGSLEVY